MKSLPYLPLFTSEFIADTQDLTDEEVGGYIRILMYSWNKGGPVEKKRAIRLLDDSKNVWPALSQFFIEQDGMISNKRLEKERKKSIDLYEKKSNAGKAGAEARWQNDSTAIGKRNGKPHGTDDSTGNGKSMLTHNSSLITKNKENSELKNNNTVVTNDQSDSNRETPSPESELTVLSFFSEYPSLNFPNMTIPRLVQLTVLDVYGEKALRHILNELSGVQDVKKRYSPQYVKAIIQNAPLLKIKNGEADEQGQEIKEWTREEALAWCDRNGARMDKSFVGIKTKEGEVARFENGKAKFLLVTPNQMVSALAEGFRS